VRDLAERLGTPHVDCRQDGAKLDASRRAGYLFNTTIGGIDQADACLLVGTNPRWEAPIVNARLRKRWRAGGLKVGRIGAVHPLTYPVEELGAGTDTLAALARGEIAFAETLRQAKHPMLVLGMGALARPDGAAVLNLAADLAEELGLIKPDWNGFNVLHTAAARVGGLDLGLVPGQGGRDVAGILAGAEGGEVEVVFLVGADELDTARLGNAFVVYQGHHGDRGARAADVVLPGAAYTEKNACWVNTEGRLQRGKLAVFPPGEAKEDWKILRALSEVLGRKVPLDTVGQVRARMAALAPPLDAFDRVAPAAWGGFGEAGVLDRAPFRSPIGDFYRTDPISRASGVMEECSRLFAGGRELGATGTHG
jgi:NADH-quinone oxidoreductase subunit G